MQKSFVPLIENHLRRLSATGVDVYGPQNTAMWMAVLDTRTGLPPEREHIPQRVYRLIGAPRGSTLYWDQPLVVAGHELGNVTGDRRHTDVADAYIEAFLTSCVREDGIFQWGNHQYYDAFKDTVVAFEGGFHELRPITPAWDLFWRHDPLATAKYIRAMAARHVYDGTTGGFNRHDDGRRGHAFLEAGAVLLESLAWLHARNQDPGAPDMALRIARYSYEHRGESTGLVCNEPDHGRWDSRVSTTEVGLWSQSLLRAAEYSGHEAFARMAAGAIRAYLEYGYDSDTGRFYGQLNVENGQPVVPPQPGYWPGKYADVWNIGQWPTHDYPMALAEACLTLYLGAQDRVYLEGVKRWAKAIALDTPARKGDGAYAENYGRCIHFLARAGRALDEKDLLSQARALADEAVTHLYADGMFQGYPGIGLYESVDGVGFLCLALLCLDTGGEVPLHGFGF
jgi:hypothetical protein